MAIQDFVTGQVLTAAQMDALQANDYNQTVSAKVASYVLTAADKGTRVTMSNAGATTITVNTSLFAAGDTLFITNIGAGACTITAGTATVSTASSLVLAQYDSGRLYFTSTGVAIWEKYQGAAAGTSGLTLIKRAAFSAVAGTSTTFDGVFTSTYKTYLASFEYVEASSYLDDLQLQLIYSGTTKTATYYGTTLYSTHLGGPTNLPSNNTAQFTLATEASCSGEMYFNKVGNTSQTAAIYGVGQNMAGFGPLLWGCTQDLAQLYTGFLLKSSSSTITGTIAVYGLATV